MEDRVRQYIDAATRDLDGIPGTKVTWRIATRVDQLHQRFSRNVRRLYPGTPEDYHGRDMVDIWWSQAVIRSKFGKWKKLQQQ